jgi:hypothetical protein
MGTGVISEGWSDLVEELKQLETFIPVLGNDDDREEIEEEIEDLQKLITTAGEPEDEHSMRALTFLQTELARKREMLDGLHY